MKALLIISISSFYSFSSFSQEENCNWNIPKELSEDADFTNENDYEFLISCDCQINDFELSIYNRSGNLVFKTNDINETWNATEEKKSSYFYIIKGTIDDKEITKKGHVAVKSGV